MSGSKVDQATYDKLVEAYRLDPGNHSAASRYAGVQRRTARRVWDHGNEAKGWKPAKVLIAEDVELAKAKTQLEQDRLELMEDQVAVEMERDREAIRLHSVAARKEEAALVVLARQAAIRSIAAAAAASEGLKGAMERIGKELKEMAEGGPMSKKELAMVSSITRRYASTLREVVVAGQLSMEMERLYLGKPTEIVGVTTDLDTMPLDDLVRLAGYQDGVLQRAAQRGLVVLEGGLKKDAG